MPSPFRHRRVLLRTSTCADSRTRTCDACYRTCVPYRPPSTGTNGRSRSASFPWQSCHTARPALVANATARARAACVRHRVRWRDYASSTPMICPRRSRAPSHRGCARTSSRALPSARTLLSSSARASTFSWTCSDSCLHCRTHATERSRWLAIARLRASVPRSPRASCRPTTSASARRTPKAGTTQKFKQSGSWRSAPSGHAQRGAVVVVAAATAWVEMAWHRQVSARCSRALARQCAGT
mmetsp:Transcript_12424/g.52242  ORF Transcript_12424/g.52242 Transcript_12424/m.52242 type:complete len:241 (+) Transcript_12424:3467-4189(+)